jgi:ribonuclease HII
VHRGVELECTLRFEQQALASGHSVVAGLDEVGRGALCGPVVAAAVVLGPGFPADGLDDSKRLTAKQREALAERIRAEAQAFALGVVDHGEIDRINILRATLLAMKQAVQGLPVRPDLLLIDALALPELEVEQLSIVKGDAQCASIAAASILAKVTRDALMLELDQAHPGYHLAHNMGYASEEHRLALRRLGPSKIHRRSFGDVAQGWLFW